MEVKFRLKVMTDTFQACGRQGMKTEGLVVCVCVSAAHNAPSLEGSDQRETSRDISPLYTSEREGWVTRKPVCLCW